MLINNNLKYKIITIFHVTILFYENNYFILVYTFVISNLSFNYF